MCLLLRGGKERTRKIVRQKFKAKVVYASSEATVYDSDGNVVKEHKPKTKTIIQQMFEKIGYILMFKIRLGLTRMANLSTLSHLNPF